MSFEKDKPKSGTPKSGPNGNPPARKTVVGVPVLPDAAVQDPPSKPGPRDDELPTAIDLKAITVKQAHEVLSDRPPSVKRASSRPPPAPKMPAVAGAMFRGLRRPADRAPSGEVRRAALESARPPKRVPQSSRPAPPGGSVEEISASLLVPDDGPGNTRLSEAEELSGSLLVEEPGEGGGLRVQRPAATAPMRPSPTSKPPVPRGSAPPERRVTTKPPLPKSASKPPSTRPDPNTVPAAHEDRTLPRPIAIDALSLGEPGAPEQAPRPAEAPPPGDGIPPPPFTDAVYDLPPVIPAPPALGVEPVEPAAAMPSPGRSRRSSPVPAGQAPASEASRRPSSPGDVELTALPRSFSGRALDALRDVREQAEDRLSSALRGMGSLSAGSRPPWFLPAVGVLGLVVGVGLVGLTVKLAKGGGRASSGEAPTAASEAIPEKEVTGAPAVPSAAAHTTASSTLTACTARGTARALGFNATVGAGVEMAVSGGDIGLGFALDDYDAMGMRIDPANLAVVATAKAQSRDPIRRVTPLLSKSGLSLLVDADIKNDALQGRRTLAAAPPLQVGTTSDGKLAWAKVGGPPAGTLWPLEGDAARLDALRGEVDPSDPSVMGVAFRSAGAIWLGSLTQGEGGPTAQGPLSRMSGLGTMVGSPALAVAHRVGLAAWADRAANDAPWQLRWTRFAVGSAPTTPSDFVPPAGGVGGSFMSPALAALPGGRFLLMWTEGAASSHVVRALTLGPDGGRLGSAIDLSPAGSNAGQARGAVTDQGEGVVAYLQSAGTGFEVAATSVRCESH